MRFRVATYNIAGAIAEDRRFYSRWRRPENQRRIDLARGELDRIARWARDADVDVLALQEVDICRNGRDTLHQAGYLAGALRMHYAYVPGFDYDLLGLVTVTTGVAVLSRHPIRRWQPIRYPTRELTRARRVRACLVGAKRGVWVTLHVQGRDVQLLNAHLTHDADAQKLAELDALLALCKTHDPCILVGDLNFTPRATRSADMHEPHYFGHDACPERLQAESALQWDARLFGPAIRELCTYPADRPSIKLDYALLHSRTAVFEAETVAPVVARSNHLPIVATFAL